jgi:hypothetical protein
MFFLSLKNKKKKKKEKLKWTLTSMGAMSLCCLLGSNVGPTRGTGACDSNWVLCLLSSRGVRIPLGLWPYLHFLLVSNGKWVAASLHLQKHACLSIFIFLIINSSIPWIVKIETHKFNYGIHQFYIHTTFLDRSNPLEIKSNHEP